MPSTYPVTSPCIAIPGNLIWCYSRSSRNGVERNCCQRAQQSTGGKSKYFDLHHFYINMPQTFTFNRGSLCRSVKIGNRLRCGQPNDRCSIPVSSRLLCSNPSYTRSDPGSFVWGEYLQRATQINLGYVACLTWKNLIKLYT